MKITPDSELENLRDEEYLIFRAKEGQSINTFAAKSWLITAQTIFPKDFGIQFEIYKIGKQEKNVKEAAKCLNNLFQNFENESALWVEIDVIMTILTEASSENSSTSFMSKIFFALPKEIQKNMILAAVQKAKDEITYVSLMLLLTSSFPENTANNGLPLANALMKAEKNTTEVLNPFRKKLVCDLLPRFLQAEGLEVRPKLLYMLLSKAIEFYVVYSTTPLRIALAKLELENGIEDPWQDLFSIIRLIGWNLGWELASEFDLVSNRELILQRVQNTVESGARLGGRKGDNGEDTREIFFITVTLFLHALLDYNQRLNPDVGQEESPNLNGYPPSMTLVEAFTSAEKEEFQSSALGGLSSKMLLSPTPKRLRPSIEEEESPAIITVSRISQLSPSALPAGAELSGSLSFGASCIPPQFSISSGAISLALVTAIKCWNLLNAYESLRTEFCRFSEELKLGQLVTIFNLDVFIYEGRLVEAENQLRLALTHVRSGDHSTSSKMVDLTLNLKLASVLFALNKISAAAEALLKAIEHLSPLNALGGLTPNLIVPAPPLRRHLHVLALTRSQCLQFIVTLLVNSLRNLIVVDGNSSDACLGHLIILLQFEWPRHCHIFEELIEIIRKKGGFTFKYFASYVTTADMLEEFMFISNSFGIALDILPLANNTKQQRMSTRGADRDSKQDFKAAMKKQMQRSFESVESNLLSYLIRYGLYVPQLFL